MSFSLFIWGFRCLLLKKIFNSLSMVVLRFHLEHSDILRFQLIQGEDLILFFCILRSSQFYQEVYPLLILVHEMHLLLGSIFVLQFLYLKLLLNELTNIGELRDVMYLFQNKHEFNIYILFMQY